MTAELAVSPSAGKGESATALVERVAADPDDAVIIPAMRSGGCHPADPAAPPPTRRGGNAKTVLVLPDLHMPLEDRKALTAVIRFVGEFQPDEVVHVGALANSLQPRRRNEGVQADADYIKRRFLDPLRDAYAGPFGVLAGNRGTGLHKRRDPATSDADQLALERVLDFDGFGVIRLPDIHEFAPKWAMARGPFGGISVSPIAGNTALNAAKKMGRSVILGQTKRLGMGSHTVNCNGNVMRTLTGVEVGNLIDMKAVGQLTKSAENWQQGFALVRVEGTRVQPQIIRISGHRFAVEGVVYQVGG